jgi:hypothetical protein
VTSFLPGKSGSVCVSDLLCLINEIHSCCSWSLAAITYNVRSPWTTYKYTHTANLVSKHYTSNKHGKQNNYHCFLLTSAAHSIYCIHTGKGSGDIIPRAILHHIIPPPFKFRANKNGHACIIPDSPSIQQLIILCIYTESSYICCHNNL